MHRTATIAEFHAFKKCSNLIWFWAFGRFPHILHKFRRRAKNERKSSCLQILQSISYWQLISVFCAHFFWNMNDIVIPIPKAMVCVIHANQHKNTNDIIWTIEKETKSIFNENQQFIPYENRASWVKTSKRWDLCVEIWRRLR